MDQDNNHNRTAGCLTTKSSDALKGLYNYIYTIHEFFKERVCNDLKILKKWVDVEFERNPYLVVFLGTLFLFCAIPLSGFIIFSLLSTLVLLAIFLVAEGVVLGCSFLFFVGSATLMIIAGAFTGALVTCSYYGYKQLEKVRTKVD